MKVDSYKGLDREPLMEISLSTREIAKRICAANYGAHRLLSAMVHELRERQETYVKEEREKDCGLPENCRLNLTDGDMESPLANEIEAALNKGYYY